MILNCITIDDEPPALVLLENYIGKTPFIKLLSSFSNAADALIFLNDNAVDLIFLDVQMPEFNGLEFARIIAGKHTNFSAKIIFTTAFDNFAIEGYRLDVMDYLLKPYTYEDFFRAASKALGVINLMRKVEEGQNTVAEDEQYLYLKVEHQMVKVPVNDILFIEGLKDYAKIHLKTDGNPLMSLITLKALEEKLSGNKFLRVHKSFIVSLDKITAVTKTSVIIGKSSIPVSEQYKDAFNSFLITWR
ncbi:MAG TPA: LytTR family DNA-binding domain-containing protein [Flavitalea sp.]|nr:LytTR family DNA-binding domain-containing protein [Flavitalea sp.]